MIFDNWNKEKKKITVGTKKMKMSEFKNKHRIGYTAIKHYDLEVLKLTDGTKIRQLHWLEEGQKPGGIVVPMNRVFIAIKSAHGRNKHLKVQATYMKLKQVFWNIKEQEVRHFISVCPSCNAEPPEKKARLGTKMPIHLNCFGDCVQFD